MPVRKSVIVASGYEDPDTSEGRIWALKDGTGSVWSAGYDGTTRKHPLPLTGGARVFLGTDGMQADASTGWNLLTGTAVQAATGITMTLSASNPEVIIDFPGLGEVVCWEALAEMDITCASPGTGNKAGLRMDSNSVAYERGAYVYFDGADWLTQADKNGTMFYSSFTIPLGDVGYVAFNSMPYTWAFRYWGVGAGIMGQYLPESPDLVIATGGENIQTPTTWDLAFRAEWISGDDIVITLKSIAVTDGPLSVSTVD